MTNTPPELDELVSLRTRTTHSGPDNAQAAGPRLERRFVLGTRTPAFLVLLALYALPGLVGHAPW
jgi:hypothetical protein